ncbi:copper chaperone PCu(A)C [Neorhizobium sp. NPDC001467]|uniref:copper chaperone PCu(A)C n=1 Tax=Neorhizobium sp. NPDC001467 TaxID=3390595 RepID=UPI003D038AC1
MKSKTQALFVLLALLTVSPAAAHDYAVGQIEIGHPYARAMVPVAKVGGGYLKITNKGPADRLLSATSDRAGSVEFHTMKMNGTVMEMRALPSGIAVPANATIELKPGADHVMFMNVAKPFRQGETIRATLLFERAGRVDVEFTVGPLAAGKGMDHAEER